MATQEDRPQDNQSFKMNDAPVHQGEYIFFFQFIILLFEAHDILYRRLINKK